MSTLFNINAYADVLNLPTDIGAPTNQQPIRIPTRGMTMEDVSANFGEPIEKIDPVGNPPISRWNYAKFVVHFERQYVIHTVVKK